MKEELYNDNFENENEKPVDYKAILLDYLMYWPWIVGCAVIALIACFIYLRFKAPTYNVNATVLIKEGDQNRRSIFGGNNMIDDMQSLGMMSMASNFDNEVEILQSRNLVRKVVENLNLYIRYSQKQTFSYALQPYKNTPVSVWMTPQEAQALYAPVKLDIVRQPNGSVDVEATFVAEQEGDEQTTTQHFPKLPAVLNLPVGVITLKDNMLPADSLTANAPKPENKEEEVAEENVNVQAVILPPTAVAAGYSANLSAEPTSKTTSIVALNLGETNPVRGADFINTLVALYNSDTNDDKNEVASKTAQFIDERIQIINAELGTTEQQLASYKQQAGLTNLRSDAELALKENSEYNQKRAENATQLRLVGFLQDYINNPANEWEVIPANVGLTDQTLTSAIDNYNQLLVERKRLLRTSSESNPAVITLDTSIRATRTNVKTTVQSVEKGLLITKSDLDRQASQFEARISNAPQQERQLLSISRQQDIKANLYMMLLQKREENAITLAATANNGRMINPPMANVTGPNKKLYMLIALILGLGLPVGFIYVRNLLRFKIENRADIEKITALPVIGDVPNSSAAKENPIVIHENKNDIMEEIYRSVRTNVQYMLQPGQNVVLFTSTSPSEGKSFNAANLAVSFAYMGKKVIIVGLDIRKPGLNKIFRLSHKEKGITQYLADPTLKLESLWQQSEVTPNLYILPGGTVPPNPTELVSREALKTAIDTLRANFDYVILDTAPIGMVTDTQIIARQADMSVYVCRADYTLKSDFEIVNSLNAEKKLPNMCILLNDLNMDKRKNGYYYGYGKYGKYGKYGYGKKYGYGYGYGYGKDTKKS